MSAHGIEARYQRLLRAYPQGPRREEILDTLMEAADGRSRPSATETVNLVRHGLRARLGRPGSIGVVVAAVLVSLVTGYLAAAAVAAVAWQATPAFADRPALSTVLFPNQVVEERTDSSRVVSVQGWRGHLTGSEWRDSYGRQYLKVRQPAGTDLTAWMEQARTRLTTAGWDYRDGDNTANEQQFWAVRDGYAVSLLAVNWSDGVPETSAALVRTQPWWLTALALAGGGLGAVLGWFLTGWVSRRTEHRGRAVRRTVTMLTSVVLVLMAPFWAEGTYIFISDATVRTLPDSPLWSPLFAGWGVLVFGFFWFEVAVVATLGILIAAARSRHRAPEPATTPGVEG
jgi:membrane protein YqaA with SNARE-associated domain